MDDDDDDNDNNKAEKILKYKYPSTEKTQHVERDSESDNKN
jgi:hypothetical protein